jgi:hypothetical protein
LIDLRVKVVEVDEGVDSRSLEGLHAGCVVAGCIDVVDANCVGPYRLHEGGVQGALRAIDQRVSWNELVGDACVRQSLPPNREPNTFHEPLVSVAGKEFGALGSDRRQRNSQSRQVQQEKEEHGFQDARRR